MEATKEEPAILGAVEGDQEVPAYMGAADADFLRLADVALVVTEAGATKRLPAHSPLLSRHLKVGAAWSLSCLLRFGSRQLLQGKSRLPQVLSPLLALAVEGSMEPPVKRAKIAPGSRGSSSSCQLLLEVEEPLAGYSEAAVAALLTFVHDEPLQPSRGVELVKGAVAGKDWELLSQLVRLVRLG